MPTSQQLPRDAVRALPQDRRPGNAKSLRAVGSYLPKVTSAVFERFGFHSAEILTSWPAIVGNDIARLAQPLSIKWPRGDRSADAKGGRDGGTLVVSSDPAFTLEISYRTAEIADRINRYFGYRAVARIKIQQSPGFGDKPAKSEVSARVGFPRPAPSGDLSEALENLRNSVLSAGHR